ncbi:MAG: hypothetical protein LBG59_07790 [Candidatus Peribacteria bacterium]|nr:hypothetical protein [Candidatus Peribacteria bacterium]
MTGTLSPASTYGDLYNPALKQKLAEIYFTAMGNTPVVGDAVFFDNI